jgi:hypothetical protein
MDAGPTHAKIFLSRRAGWPNSNNGYAKSGPARHFRLLRGNVLLRHDQRLRAAKLRQAGRSDARGSL